MNKTIFVWILTFILVCSFVSAQPVSCELYYNFNTGSGSTVFDQCGSIDSFFNGSTWSSDVPIYNTSGSGSPFSAEFIPVNDFVRANSFSLAVTNYSMSWWARSDVAQASGTFRDYVRWGNSANNNIFAYFSGFVDSSTSRYRVYSTTGSTVQIDYGVALGTTWRLITLTVDDSNNLFKLYVDGSFKQQIAMTFTPRTAGVPLVIGNRDASYAGGGSNEGFDGTIDQFWVFNKVLNDAEIANLFNFGSIEGAPPATANFTITATDSFDDSPLFNLTANITFSNGSSQIYINATGNFIQTDFPVNDSVLVNITLSSTDYFNTNVVNKNLSTSLVSTLNQSFIGFNLTDILGNPISTGNITILGQTEDLNFTWNLKAGNYNVTGNSEDFNPVIQEVSIIALDFKNITIENLTNVVLNITAIYSLTGASILNFTVNVTGQTSGLNILASTTTGNIILGLVNETYSVFMNATGFVPDTKSVSVQSDTDLVFGLFQIGDLQIDVFNTTDGGLFGQNVTLKLQNATTQRTLNLENGSDFVTGLNYGVVYTLIFSSPGFSTNLYNLLYDQNQNANIFNAFLTVNNTEQIIYTVTDTRDVNLEDALVLVERFVNDTRVEVGSQLTDVTGQTTFLLDVSEGVIVTITKEGYAPESHSLNAPLSDAVSFQLTFIAPVNYTNRMTDVTWSVAPSNTELNTGIVNFTFNVDSVNDDLIFSRIRIFNGSVLVASLTDTNASGNILVLPVNVTPYVNGTLRMEVTFQKEGFEEFVKDFVYIVRDADSSFGSLLAVRIWFQNNTDIGTRVQFWLILFVIGVVLIASMSFALFNDPLKGIAIIMPYVIVTGWLVAINFIVLGFLSTIMLLGIVLSKRSGGLET